MRLVLLGVVSLVVACDDASDPTKRSLPNEVPQLAVGSDDISTQLIPTPRSRSSEVVPATVAAGPPVALAGVVDVGSGSQFSCALRDDGQVFCWGANTAGQFGNGSLAPSRTPVETSGPQRFVDIAVGDLNVCGLLLGGEAYCWGDNSVGQLGIGVTGGIGLVPAPVGGGHLFVSLSIGLRSICGIATDGVTYCWGNNQFGQLGIGVTGAPVNTPTAVVNSATLGFTDVSAGFFASCARTLGGQVYCWGAAGPYFGNGATNPASNVPVPAASGLTVPFIDVGAQYACVVTAIGRGGCWGTQFAGELGNGSFASPVTSPTPLVGTQRFTSIDPNAMNTILGFSCGLVRTGQAWCWGSNQFSQLGTTGASTCTFGLSVFNCSAEPLAVSHGRRYTRLAVGVTHVCAFETTGNVYCWGDNRSGQLGNNTLTQSMTPVKVVRLDAQGRDGYVAVTPLSGTIIFLEASLQLNAQLLNEDGTPATVQPPMQWKSSDPTIASVSATGLVTGHANGSVVISVRAQSGQFGYAPITVNILDPNDAFQFAWSGSASGRGANDGLVVWGGLLTDEWLHSDTFLGRLAADRRALQATEAELSQLFNNVQIARQAAEFEEGRLLGVAPTDPRIGQMRVLSGYIHIGLAEAFCSGVPLDDPNTGLSTTDLFTTAEARFTQALAGPVAPPYDMLARMGQARARLGLGDVTGAASAAALIPSTFLFSTTHSTTPGFENLVYVLNTQQRRLTIPDGEGGNGLPWRTASDPRVPWVAGVGFGFDAVTPWFIGRKYMSAADNIVVASGTEARLIEAEAQLRTGNAAGFMAALNALRATIGLPALLDPGNQLARENLLFSERANWLYATGTRLGDVRRLINQYGRSESTVLPTGAYHKGGTYGSDANLPVPLSARGPSYSGCTARTS